ncbi:MAG: two-component regulator propeller domain-containing protein, partial [Bacteroidota bacterium]
PHKAQGFAQDKYGYLWIGSSDGFYRFDGVTFKQYIHNEEDTNSTGLHFCHPFLVDSRGTLWTKNASGLSMLNTSTRQFRNFNFSDTLFNDVITGVTEDSKNNVWISSSGRKNLTKYEALKNKFTAYTVPDSFYTKRMRTFGHALSIDGNIYLATDNGLIRFNTRTEKYEKRFLCLFPGKGEKPRIRGIQCVMSDKEGDVYTGFWSNYPGQLLIGRLNKKLQLIECFVAANISKNYVTLNIIEKSDDELWIVTNMSGLFCFNKRSKHGILIEHQPDNPLSFPDGPTSEVNSTFNDRNGCSWINTGSKIVKADPLDQLVKRYNIGKLFGIDPNMEFFINTALKLPDHHKLFIGTWAAAGLYEVDLRYNKVKVNKTYKDKELKECGIQQIIKDHKGEFLAITQQQILKYNKGIGKFISCWTVPDSIRDNFAFTSIMEDDRGHLWMGTYRHGVYDFNPQDFSYLRYSKQVYNPVYDRSDMIKPCFQDIKGNIWFSSFDGVYVFSLKNKSFSRISYKPGDRNYNDARDMLKDKKGNIWRSTARGGFQEYNPKTGMFELVKSNIDTRPFIMGDMTEDNRGYIWLSADEEICRFDPVHHQFLFPKQTMNLEMGTQIIGFCAEDGTLYTSCSPVLYETNTNLFNGNPQVPEIVFNNFKVLNRDTVFSENLNEIKTVTLPYDKNFISLEFAALNFSHSENNQYAYKLDGVDKDWVMNGNKNSASYSNLGPGKHVFHVKACNNTGLWNEEGRSLVIIITPPWWQRWWFSVSIAVMAMMFMLSAMKLYNARKLRIQKTEFEKQLALDRERSRISRDLHDEVGSTLSSINIIANMDETSAMLPEEKLNRIKKQTHSVLEKMGEIIWLMNPANNSFENIFTHIKEYASELLEAKEIAFGFQAEGDFSAIHIPVEQRRDLYLIMKESINNLAKYSECTRTNIHITIENSKLIVRITDNGKGFDDATTPSGNGLVNMRKRAEGLNAIFSINSELNQGTCILLIMPIA